MKIVGVDEIPEESKTGLDDTGLKRYQLFTEELVQVFRDQSSHNGFTQSISKKGLMILLGGTQRANFPYKDIKISKYTPNCLNKMNKSGCMGVLLKEDVKGKTGSILFLEGKADNVGISVAGAKLVMPNITI